MTPKDTVQNIKKPHGQEGIIICFISVWHVSRIISPAQANIVYCLQLLCLNWVVMFSKHILGIQREYWITRIQHPYMSTI